MADDTLRYRYCTDDGQVQVFTLPDMTQRLSDNSTMNHRSFEMFSGAFANAVETGSDQELDCFINIPSRVFERKDADEDDSHKLVVFDDGFKWWHIVFACVEDDEDGVTVLGAANVIDKAAEEQTRLAAIMAEQASLLKPLKPKTLLLLMFDIRTGERTRLQDDVLFRGIPEDVTLPDLIDMMVAHAPDRDAHEKLRNFDDPQVLKDAREGKPSRMDFDCRLTPYHDSSSKPRWFGVTYRYARNPINGDIDILITALDIDTNNLAQLDLIEQATKDTLTGLMNRKTFEDRCTTISDEAKTERHLIGSSFNDGITAFVLIEADSFERINDLHGFSYGDHIMKQIGETLRALIREGDFAAHFAAARFALVMRRVPDTSLLHERVRILKSALTRPLEDGDDLTISIGISVYPDDGLEYKALFVEAESALYHARKAGGDTVVFYRDIADRDHDPHTAVSKAAIVSPSPRVSIRTFGFFDVFVDGQAVVFHSAKSKELLALLVDRRGGYITSSEGINYLWEDETADKLTLARYRKTAMRLRENLAEYGIDDIIEAENGKHRIIPEKVDCDLYHYLAGDKDQKCTYSGSYLNNYSWGESTLAMLDYRQELFERA